ncbi:unnamed protein product, partial [Mesorhabditis spiculigera]
YEFRLPDCLTELLRKNTQNDEVKILRNSWFEGPVQRETVDPGLAEATFQCADCKEIGLPVKKLRICVKHFKEENEGKAPFDLDLDQLRSHLDNFQVCGECFLDNHLMCNEAPPVKLLEILCRCRSTALGAQQKEQLGKFNVERDLNRIRDLFKEIQEARKI